MRSRRARRNPSSGRILVLAAHEYPRESEYATPDGAFIRSVAHDLKGADVAAIRVAAVSLAPMVPRHGVLVPVPGSRGSTRENLKLAEAISRLSGARVVDGLEREASESQHARRRAGKSPLTPDAMRVRWGGGIPRSPVFLVDNVLTTGATAEAARRAIGGDVVALVWADASRIA